jgi:VanZ family protein
MRQPAFAIVLWSAWLVWAAGILFASSLTPEELPAAAFVLSDKVLHFAAFTVGGWLAANAWRASGRPRSRRGVFLAAVALTAAFAAFDEASQLLTPGRHGGDLYDWIADFLGAIAGAIIADRTHGHLDRILARR